LSLDVGCWVTPFELLDTDVDGESQPVEIKMVRQATVSNLFILNTLI